MGAGPVGLVLFWRSAHSATAMSTSSKKCRTPEARAILRANAHPVGDYFDGFFSHHGMFRRRMRPATRTIELVLPRVALVPGLRETPRPVTIEEGGSYRLNDFYMIRTFYFPVL